MRQPGGQEGLAGEGRDTAWPGLMSPCCPATSQGMLGYISTGDTSGEGWGAGPEGHVPKWEQSSCSTHSPPQMAVVLGGTGAGAGWGDSAGHWDRDGRWNTPLSGSCPIAPPAAPFHIPSSQTPPSPGMKGFAWPKSHTWLCRCSLGKGNQPPPGRGGATLVVLQHFLQRGFEHRTRPSWDLCPGGEVVLGTEGIRGSLWAAAPILEAQPQASGQECSGGMSSRDYVCYKKHQHLSPLLPKALRGGKRDLKSNLLH